jgi:hypothetical protein
MDARRAILPVVTLTDLPRSVVRASMLDVGFYNEVEHDRSATLPAFVVVLVATAVSGVGSAIATEANVVLGMLGGALTGVIGWLVWSAMSLVVGRYAFAGTSDYGEMLRVIGFAFAPLAIGIIPWLGFVGALWSLVAAVIAIREGLDFTTVRAVVTMVAGWATWLLLSVAVHAVIDIQIGAGWPF